MKMTKVIMALLFMCFGVMAWASVSVHGKVTVTVVDEVGQPISGADVEIGFKYMNAKKPGEGWGVDVDYHPKKGTSDGVGIFSGEDNTFPEVSVIVKKQGYYKSAAGVIFKDGINDVSTKIVLKKKRNPVAMYAKKTDVIKIPAYDTPVGYDLEVGDWVAPYGKGQTSDFVFNFKERYNNWDDYDSSYVLTFSNPNDGIQEFSFDKEDKSCYRWPFEAPETGYISELKKFLSCRPKEAMKTNLNINDNVKYIFRVRTQVDKDGKIIEAKYGKIKGEIMISQKEFFRFTYFFNPDGTRNLEYAWPNNLFIPAGVNRNKKQYEKYSVNDID